MTTMLRLSDSVGCVSPFSSGKNFWMVVKTTPPAFTESLLRRSARLSAWVGGWRRRSWHREKVPKSWSSRSLRSVKVVRALGLRLHATAAQEAIGEQDTRSSALPQESSPI